MATSSDAVVADDKADIVVQHTFTDLSRVLTNATNYDGNATAYDWTVDKGEVQLDNGELALILTESNGGTRISTTRYVHYGKISASSTCPSLSLKTL